MVRLAGEISNLHVAGVSLPVPNNFMTLERHAKYPDSPGNSIFLQRTGFNHSVTKTVMPKG